MLICFYCCLILYQVYRIILHTIVYNSMRVYNISVIVSGVVSFLKVDILSNTMLSLRGFVRINIIIVHRQIVIVDSYNCYLFILYYSIIIYLFEKKTTDETVLLCTIFVIHGAYKITSGF